MFRMMSVDFVEKIESTEHILFDWGALAGNRWKYLGMKCLVRTKIKLTKLSRVL